MANKPRSADSDRSDTRRDDADRVRDVIEKASADFRRALKPASPPKTIRDLRLEAIGAILPQPD